MSQDLIRRQQEAIARGSCSGRVVAPAEQQETLDRNQLEEVLGQLVGRRLIGYRFEETMLHLEFEGGVWLRYTDIVKSP